MKNNRFLLLLASCFIVHSMNGATVRIKNLTGKPVWARINNSTRPFLYEEQVEQIFTDIKNAIGMTAAGVTYISALGVAAFPFTAGWSLLLVPAALTGVPFYTFWGTTAKIFSSFIDMKTAVNFKELTKDGTFFNSDFDPIDKVTFLRPTKYVIETLPAQEIIKRWVTYGKKYGNMGAVVDQDKKTKEYVVLLISGFWGESWQGNETLKKELARDRLVSKLMKEVYEQELKKLNIKIEHKEAEKRQTDEGVLSIPARTIYYDVKTNKKIDTKQAEAKLSSLEESVLKIVKQKVDAAYPEFKNKKVGVEAKASGEKGKKYDLGETIEKSFRFEVEDVFSVANFSPLGKDKNLYRLTFKVKSLNDLVTAAMPVFETFTYNPKIGGAIVEARIELKGWKNAVRKDTPVMKKIEKGVSSAVKDVKKGVEDFGKKIADIF